MKKLNYATQLAIISLASTAMMQTAHAADWDCCYSLDAYAGVDAQMRRMHFQKNFGGNILKHRYPEGNIFAGVKFNDYVGIEAGYEFSKKQHSTKVHQVGDVVFGVPIPPVRPGFLSITNASRASSKLTGFNLNLMGFLPIFCKEYNTQLIGSVGFVNLKSRTRNIITERDTFEIFNPDLEIITETVTFNSQYKKHKTILKYSAGIQWMATNCLGIRGLVTRENTAKLRARGRDIQTGQILQEIAKLKNASIYSFGVFTTF